MRAIIGKLLKSFIAIGLAITLSPMILDSCSSEATAEASVAHAAVTNVQNPAKKYTITITVKAKQAASGSGSATAPTTPGSGGSTDGSTGGSSGGGTTGDLDASLEFTEGVEIW